MKHTKPTLGDIWTTTELFKWYLDKQEQDTNPSRFLAKLEKALKGEVYFFKGPGIATLAIHKDKADTIFNESNLKQNYHEDLDLATAANSILKEVKTLPHIDKDYPLLDEDMLADLCSPTLEELLILILPNLADIKKYCINKQYDYDNS